MSDDTESVWQMIEVLRTIESALVRPEAQSALSLRLLATLARETRLKAEKAQYE